MRYIYHFTTEKSETFYVINVKVGIVLVDSFAKPYLFASSSNYTKQKWILSSIIVQFSGKFPISTLEMTQNHIDRDFTMCFKLSHWNHHLKYC